MKRNSQEPKSKEACLLSSGFLIDRKNNQLPSTTPILMDNLTLRVKILTGMPLIGLHPPKSLPTRKFRGLEQIATAFANPFLYPSSKGTPRLNMFGPNTLRTNGRRIYRHVIGDPLVHNLGHNDKVELEDKHHNQVIDSELPGLSELAKSNRQDPATWQIQQAINLVEQGYYGLIEQYQLDVINRPENFAKNVGVNRLEIFFETLGFFEDDEITSVMHKVIYKYFGPADQHRDRLERSHDKEDSNALMAWVVSSNRISSEFRKTEHDFKIKIYKKRDRIRIEIQANYPKLVASAKWDGTSSPFIALTENLFKIKDILSERLHLIWGEFDRLLQKSTDPIDLRPLIAKRLAELRPNKSKHESSKKIINHLANMGSITLADLEQMDWSVNDLNCLRDSEYGFLKRRPTGFDDAEGKGKRIVGAVYILVPEWLNRTGKPSQKPKVSQVQTFNTYEKFQDLVRYSSPDPMDALNGSAVPNRKLLFA